jgi:hypothetical protein
VICAAAREAGKVSVMVTITIDATPPRHTRPLESWRLPPS